MKIILYNMKSELNAVNKELEKYKELDCVLLSSVDVIRPIVRLTELPGKYNYCYLEKYNRYYFVDGFSVNYNGLSEVSLRIDPLYTYKDLVLQSTARITQSENILNPGRTDYQKEHTETVTEIDFENPFTGNSDVLVTVQGDYNPAQTA